MSLRNARCNDKDEHTVFFLLMAVQPHMGIGVLIIEVTQSHSFRHATLSVGFWTSDRSVAETRT